MQEGGDVVPANSENARARCPAIAMDLDVATTRAIAAWLAHHRGQPIVGEVKDALWLRSLLLKQQVGLSRFERSAFRRRADRLLARLLQ